MSVVSPADAGAIDSIARRDPKLEVWVKTPTGEPQKPRFQVTEHFTYVAVDEAGKKRPVPDSAAG